MDLKDLEIYPFIKDRLDRIPRVTVKAGEYISRAGKADGGLFYVVSGYMRVECVSMKERRFWWII